MYKNLKIEDVFMPTRIGNPVYSALHIMYFYVCLKILKHCLWVYASLITFSFL